ncbi:MAG: T7SS effector LXG polymorphic toxin [Catonella sp.]|nr:T7SS effector LXG polymorphic toxin [Catonella sp.]
MSEPFRIKYGDIWSLVKLYKNNLGSFIDNAEQCKRSVQSLIDDESFKGAAADAIKAYLSEVVMTIITSAEIIAQTMLDYIGAYLTEYGTIDSSQEFNLIQEELQDFKKDLYKDSCDTKDISDDFKTTVRPVEELINDPGAASHFELICQNPMISENKRIRDEIDKLIQDVTDHEKKAYKKIKADIKPLIAALNKNLENIKLNYSNISLYKLESFSASPDLVNLVNLVSVAANNHIVNQSEYEADWEKIDYAIELEDARDTRGIVKTITGVGLVVGGGLCIVATAGAATPLVVGFGVALGGGSAVFGIFDTVEGSQYIYYGRIGDTETRAQNALLDNAFGENETAYNAVENVFGVGSAVMAPIGAISKATVPTVSAVKYTTAKTLTSMAVGQAAGAGGEGIAKVNGADDRTATLIGLGTGALAGWAAEGTFDYKLFHGDNPSNIDLSYKERTERVKQYEGYKKAVTDEKQDKFLWDYVNDNGLDDINDIDQTTLTKLESEFTKATKNEINIKTEIENDAIRHLTESDKLMREAESSGMNSKNYYKIATTPKDKRTAAAYEKALEGTDIRDKFNNAFFENGCDKAVVYQSKYAYDKYTVNGKTIGRDEGIFVMPMSSADSMENELSSLGTLDKQSQEFKRALADKLGVSPHTFDSGVVRLEIPINKNNLHIPNGTEEGANTYWVPGARTPNNYFEGKRDQITFSDNPDLYDSIIKNAKGDTK